jgi:CheY-like chemotaxis protein
MILGFDQRQEGTQFAYNGEQAVKIIKQSIDQGNFYQYSLILMDCNMPFMDGYEATKRIRRMFLSQDIPRAQQPKIVAITGHVENEYI